MSRQIANHPRPICASRALTAMLWASAVVLTLLVVVQAATWLDAQPLDAKQAYAGGMVTATGPLVAMSSEIGKEDLILIIDNRTETLGVYRLEAGGQLQQYQQLSLPSIFIEAHSKGPGRR